MDWDGDGHMDIVKFGPYSGNQTATLYMNNGDGSKFSLGDVIKTSGNVLGFSVLDYNWDGMQDLLISNSSSNNLVLNKNTISPGTAIHLRILDGEGINVFYGNTVQLYNSAGELVLSQIINRQAGIGFNDASALVSFYGLDPNETYKAVLLRSMNGESSNVTWEGLTAGDGKESYSLTADAATGGHTGTLTGTGYNDTFIAEEGNYIYNGSGGWESKSDHPVWNNTGGMDIIDFRNSATGVTVDLSNSSAQNTGYNTATLKDIEGVSGSNYDDILTGNSGDNILEGRGGNDTFNINNGGHDTLLYKLLDTASATGGNGSDEVNGFTVGTWEGTANTDRIDLHALLQGSGYTGDASAHYIDGVAHLDESAGNINDYLSVKHTAGNTEIQIDRDGAGNHFTMTTIVTLNGVETDLATLLANHQLVVI